MDFLVKVEVLMGLFLALASPVWKYGLVCEVCSFGKAADTWPAVVPLFVFDAAINTLKFPPGK